MPIPNELKPIIPMPKGLNPIPIPKGLKPIPKGLNPMPIPKGLNPMLKAGFLQPAFPLLMEKLL
jgi:hypothetical protein